MATPTDRLFAAKALVKVFDAEVKNLEKEAKEQAVADYMEGRGGQVRSPLFGKDAGYITVKAGTESHDEQRFDVIDGEALKDWMEDTDLDLMAFALEHAAEYAEWHFRRTGECPEGCRLLNFTVEGKPPSASLTVKEKVVVEELKKRPELASDTVMFLLGAEGSGVLALGDGE